jgi:hypothetical protein
MSIAARYANLFQMSYITRDLDAAMTHAREHMGVQHFDTTDADVEVLSYGKLRPLKIRAAFANIGRNQFEIIEPVSARLMIGARCLPKCARAGMNLPSCFRSSPATTTSSASATSIRASGLGTTPNTCGSMRQSSRCPRCPISMPETVQACSLLVVSPGFSAPMPEKPIE